VMCSCAPRRARPFQQPGHGVRGIDVDVGGGTVGQRGDLLLRTDRPAQRSVGLVQCSPAASAKEAVSGLSRP
jgi:hypothetical protein